MPRTRDVAPTYGEIIPRILDPLSGPISVKEFAEKVLALRPTTAKDPIQAVRNQLRQEEGQLLIFLDRETILPTRLAMRGARFRFQIDRDTMNTGLIEIDDLLSSYLPRNFPIEKVFFIDTDQQPIEYKTKSVTKKLKSILGVYDHTIIYANIGGWLRKQKAYHKDYILFTLVDWQNGVFQLEHEQYAKRQPSVLQQRNQLLADLFYEMLENSAREYLYFSAAVPSVYARLPEKSAYPPDHWLIVLKQDRRMSVNDWEIRYSDHRLSPMEIMVRNITGEPRKIAPRPVQAGQANQVYRFRAELKQSPKIWREVEIQGKQTLADLKVALVIGFNHDNDHMAGFWKLVPRKGPGNGLKRYREVELGEVNPLGEGDGADVEVAGLELSLGDRLKFVYDFGDWIEHTLTLTAIEPPQTKVKYPRESARNQPKYVNCVECAVEGEKTQAKRICLTCSEQQQRNMVLCENCCANHEDHYSVEIMY